MATFSSHAYPNGTRGSRIPKRAGGEIIMGALVAPGSTTPNEDVQEIGVNTEQILGIAVVDEAMARENESGGAAQERYNDNDPVIVEGLVNGVVYNLLSSGTAIDAGSVVTAAAGGLVAAGTVHPVGICVESNYTATATQQTKYPVKVMVQRSWGA